MKTTRKHFAMLSGMTMVLLLVCTGGAYASADNYSEDFESFTVPYVISNAVDWSATESNSVVVATNYSANYVGGDYPIPGGHTNVLKIENGVTNDFGVGTDNLTNWVDVVLKPVVADSPPDIPVGAVAATYFNTNRNLVVLHTVSNTTDSLQWFETDYNIGTNDWIRLTIVANMKDGDPIFAGDNTRFYQVWMNGEVVSNAAAYPAPTASGSNGTWFAGGADINRNTSVSNITIKGTGYLDDLVVTSTDPGLVPATEWIITASAGMNGSIAPSGTVVVAEGNNKTFTITPDSGYVIDDVVVGEGGVTNSKGAVASYTFTNVTADGSIVASFVAAPTTWTIDASAGTGGGISPTGSVVVTNGNDQAFTITPDSGYSIGDVVVGEGGVTNSKGAVSSYTFTNVTADGSIDATFVMNTTSNGTPTTWYDTYLSGETNTYEELDNLDSDGDGQLNRFEYVAGTRPDDSNSMFKVLGVTLDGAGNATLMWYGGTNGPTTPYIIESVTNLGSGVVNWGMDASQSRDDGTNTWTDSETTRKFYRVRATD